MERFEASIDTVPQESCRWGNDQYHVSIHDCDAAAGWFNVVAIAAGETPGVARTRAEAIAAALNAIKAPA